jgi:hypothetical protein
MTPTLWELEELLLTNGNLTKVFSSLKKVAREPISPSMLSNLIRYFQHKDEGLAKGVKLYNQSPSIYEGEYSTYQDWFTRRLTPKALRWVRNNSHDEAIVTPNECVIESVGRVGDTSSIIRLKKPADQVSRDLMSLGVPKDYLFVNMKLLTSHYHHVHAPISGTVTQVKPIQSSYPLFGKASLNFVQINALKYEVFLLIVGEAVVQDFDFAVATTSLVNKCDPLGNFVWGSQTVMLFPGKLEEINVRSREYRFMGAEVL